MYKKAVAALVFAEIIFGILCLGLLLTNEEEQPLEKTVFEVELNRVMLANEKEYMVEISGVRSSEQRILTYAVLDKYIRTGVCEDEKVKARIDYLNKLNAFKLKPIPGFVPSFSQE